MRETPQIRTPLDWCRYIIYGMCIGTVDLVPGVSGGTMALILGIYDALILSIQKATQQLFNLVFRRSCLKEGTPPWTFLFCLGVGSACAIVGFSQILQVLLHNPWYRQILHAAFLGMVLASVYVCFKRITRWKGVFVLPFLAGMVLTLFFTGNQLASLFEEVTFDVSLSIDLPLDHPVENYDSHQGVLLGVSLSELEGMYQRGIVTQNTLVKALETGQYGIVGEYVNSTKISFFDPWIIFCGALAISAMLLPGLSGSYLLTILGVYPLVISALADFVRDGDGTSFLLLLNLGFGIFLGALCFPRFIGFFLRHYHDATHVLLIGLMLGALHTIWPFFSYSYVLNPLKLNKGIQMKLIESTMPAALGPEVWIVAGIAVGAFSVITLLEYLSLHKKSHAIEESLDR